MLRGRYILGPILVFVFFIAPGWFYSLIDDGGLHWEPIWEFIDRHTGDDDQAMKPCGNGVFVSSGLDCPDGDGARGATATPTRGAGSATPTPNTGSGGGGSGVPSGCSGVGFTGSTYPAGRAAVVREIDQIAGDVWVWETGKTDRELKVGDAFDGTPGHVRAVWTNSCASWDTKIDACNEARRIQGGSLGFTPRKVLVNNAEISRACG